MKRLIIAGGTGFLGESLARYFQNKYEIVIFSRRSKPAKKGIRYVQWDAKTSGEWTNFIEGAEAVINLCGKNVDCRYTTKNKAEIFSSRLDSTFILGEAIRQAKQAPLVWINAASATIYRDSKDKQMTEESGETGEGFSVEVCKAWEKVFNDAQTPLTRKVNLRISMVLGNEGGVYPVLLKLVKFGLGGKMGNGKQLVSWIHIHDFCRLVDWCMHSKQAAGAYNCTAPLPISNSGQMQLLRKKYKAPFGLPSPKWLLEIGAFFIRTETELILKSRNVVPARVLAEGFQFEFVSLQSCIDDLYKKKWQLLP